MRSLHLTLSSTDSLDSSDSSEDMDARKSCTMRTLLPVLVGVLCGRALDIKLSISESGSVTLMHHTTTACASLCLTPVLHPALAVSALTRLDRVCCELARG